MASVAVMAITKWTIVGSSAHVSAGVAAVCYGCGYGVFYRPLASPGVFYTGATSSKANLASMPVVSFLKLRDDIGNVLSRRANDLRQPTNFTAS
jgi:hypothetical protein